MGLAGRLAVGAAALALVATLASGAAAAPSSAIVRSVDVGNGAAESWLFLPEHAPDCIVIVLHDRGDITPVKYDGLLAYLGISKDCASVFPRYQATTAAADRRSCSTRAPRSAGHRLFVPPRRGVRHRRR